jgi:hypothetical protein
MGSYGPGGCGCNANGWMTGASAGAPTMAQGSILPGPMQNLAQMQPAQQMAAMPMGAPVQPTAQLPAYYPQAQTFAPAQPVVAQMQVVPQNPNMPMVQTTWRPIGMQNPLPQYFSQGPQSMPLNAAPMMSAGPNMPMVVTPQAAVPVNTVNYGPVMQTAALPVVRAH